MKKTGQKQKKESSYWQEVSALFTKAGAFGIVNLFSQPGIKADSDPQTVKAIYNNQSSLSLLDKKSGSELLKEVQKIA